MCFSPSKVQIEDSDSENEGPNAKGKNVTKNVAKKAGKKQSLNQKAINKGRTVECSPKDPNK